MKSALVTYQVVLLSHCSGLWFEIASYPQRFQKGCHRTTAEYTLSDRGHVVVVNRCNRDSIDGRQSSITGKAFVQKNSGQDLMPWLACLFVTEEYRNNGIAGLLLKHGLIEAKKKGFKSLYLYTINFFLFNLFLKRKIHLMITHFSFFYHITHK